MNRERRRPRTILGVHRSPSVLYCLQRQHEGPIKIGFSSQFSRRFAELQRAHGPLRVLLTIDGARDEEREWHRTFASSRISGEWFRPTVELRALIAEVRSNHAALAERRA